MSDRRSGFQPDDVGSGEPTYARASRNWVDVEWNEVNAKCQLWTAAA